MSKGRLSWEKYALSLAQASSLRSEDPYVQVGACVLRKDNSIIGVGYNGAPPGIDIDWSNRDERRKRVIHAEVNALRYASPGEGYLLACTHLPCNDCLKMIASYGIKKVIFGEVYERDSSSINLSKEFNIELIPENV
ncbi:deoxycytidylate deaminase [bacterium]|nr:deoxycytidylate deaminase [bacterium]|tara:strand:+ start:899 stop:1309 length:411 start_codon:yes stop_codon:yes gene_type:complete